MREVAAYFADSNYGVLSNPRVRLVFDDARHFLLANREKYDIIVSEPSNLFVSGMVNLFTSEFYSLLAKRLNPGGTLAQWVHYYRIAPEDIRGILSAVHAHFPEAALWMHGIGDAYLLARSDGPLTIDYAGWIRRLADPILAKNLAEIGFTRPERIFSLLLWGPVDITGFIDGARTCTDDFPFPEFSAPLANFRPGQEQRLKNLMRQFGPVAPIPLDGETARIRLALSSLALEEGNIRRAEAETARAAELSPGQSGPLLELAKIRWRYLNDAPGALAALKPLLAKRNAEALKLKKEIGG